MTAKEFEALYDLYARPVARFLAYYTKDTAQLEDWVQLVFLRLWKYRESTELEGAYLKTYLLKIARNVALREIERSKSSLFLYKPDMGEYPPADDEEVSAADANNNLVLEKYQNILNGIPVRSQEVYRLSREEGLTYQEIADMLQISPRTVEVHIRKALQILRQELKEFQH